MGGMQTSPSPREDLSPLAAAVARVGDRWTLLLVEALLEGPARFNDLLERLPGLAPNVLTDRLKRLEREGILVARPYSERPPRLDYSLSAKGRELAGAIRLLSHWGTGGAGNADPPRHAACGTPVEPRWFCPTCATSVEDPRETGIRYL